MKLQLIRPDVAKEKHPLYAVWHWMVKAFTTKKMVDHRWLDFWAFVEDIKDHPGKDFLFHRKDHNKPYSLENYRWRRKHINTDNARAKRTAYMRKWKAKRKLIEPNYESDVALRKTYGITRAFYDDMFVKQGGKCAICKCEENSIGSNTKTMRTLAVDHCHKTGRIRGLLCSSCNRALGFFKDSTESLQSAIKYLSGGTIT